jgi:hypothetical protein
MASPNDLALQSDIPPKTKSDSKWLRDMGYRGGLHEFRISYGFKNDEVDDARHLIGQFRDEQQEEWEALRRDKASPSTLEKPTAKNSEAKTTAADSSTAARKRELVEQALLWHRRMGHASYHAILALPNAAEGVPSFEDLEVRDLPACELCTSMGADPFSLEE